MLARRCLADQIDVPQAVSNQPRGTITMHESMNKVAQVTLAFWIMKICATTLGETGGDLLSMTLSFGYAVSTVVFFGIFLVTLIAQVSSRSYHPLTYWAVIISTTTAGTTMSDYLDRTAGLGYIGGSLLLVAILISILGVWRFALGSLSVDKIDNPGAEMFYWVTILFSNTLGTALGDFLADATGLGLGYEGGALVIFAVLAVIAAAYFVTRVSRTLLFWLAFILTRPLGATLGDILTKTHEQGGLDLGTIGSSTVLGIFLVGCILLAARNRPQRKLQQIPDLRSG
jgi:uncharacterized membrane-anchored protein